MGIHTRILREKAVYWAPTGANRDGDPVYASPVELRVRWNHLTTEVTDAKGQTRVSKAEIMVESEVAHMGRLMFGALTSDTPEDPTEVETVEIFTFEKIPNVRATKSLLVAYAG